MSSVPHVRDYHFGETDSESDYENEENVSIDSAEKNQIFKDLKRQNHFSRISSVPHVRDFHFGETDSESDYVTEEDAFIDSAEKIQTFKVLKGQDYCSRIPSTPPVCDSYTGDTDSESEYVNKEDDFTDPAELALDWYERNFNSPQTQTKPQPIGYNDILDCYIYNMDDTDSSHHETSHGNTDLPISDIPMDSLDWTDSEPEEKTSGLQTAVWRKGSLNYYADLLHQNYASSDEEDFCSQPYYKPQWQQPKKPHTGKKYQLSKLSKKKKKKKVFLPTENQKCKEETQPESPVSVSVVPDPLLPHDTVNTKLDVVSSHLQSVLKASNGISSQTLQQLQKLFPTIDFLHPTHAASMSINPVLETKDNFVPDIQSNSLPEIVPGEFSSDIQTQISMPAEPQTTSQSESCVTIPPHLPECGIFQYTSPSQNSSVTASKKLFPLGDTLHQPTFSTTSVSCTGIPDTESCEDNIEPSSQVDILNPETCTNVLQEDSPVANPVPVFHDDTTKPGIKVDSPIFDPGMGIPLFNPEMGVIILDPEDSHALCSEASMVLGSKVGLVNSSFVNPEESLALCSEESMVPGSKVGSFSFSIVEPCPGMGIPSPDPTEDIPEPCPDVGIPEPCPGEDIPSLDPIEDIPVPCPDVGIPEPCPGVGIHIPVPSEDTLDSESSKETFHIESEDGKNWTNLALYTPISYFKESPAIGLEVAIAFSFGVYLILRQEVNSEDTQISDTKVDNLVINPECCISISDVEESLFICLGLGAFSLAVYMVIYYEEHPPINPQDDSVVGSSLYVTFMHSHDDYKKDDFKFCSHHYQELLIPEFHGLCFIIQLFQEISNPPFLISDWTHYLHTPTTGSPYHFCSLSFWIVLGARRSPLRRGICNISQPNVTIP